jgi:hypothetical protein
MADFFDDIGKGLGSSIGGALIGGAFDYFGGQEANKANLQAGREATAARTADRDALINTFAGTTGGRITTKGERGELSTQWLPGTSGAIAAEGDIGRATRANELGDQFNLTLPDLASAKGVIGERDALNQGRFDTGMGQLISSNRRAIGPGNSGLTPSTARAIGDFVGQNRMNSPVDAINLFQGSRQRDISDLQQQIAANQRQEPMLTSPAGAASAVLAQSPSIPPRADLGSAILPSVGSNIVAQMQQREALAESRKQQNAMLEAILARPSPVSTDRGAGNEGALSNWFSAVMSE